MKRIIKATVTLLLLPALIPACQSPEADTDQPWKQNGKLQVSANGHFLEHENGVPFLWLGGTVWGMTEWMTREEVDLYLDNRKEKGFSVVQVCLAWGKREEDPVQFHVNPVNASHPGFSERLFDLENSKDYGKFLGERYKAAPNIIWILGGDVSADAGRDFTLVYRTMAEGIIQGITGKKANWNQADPIWDMALITYHPDGNPTKNSSSRFHTDPWLDFNMIETHIYRDSLSKAVLRDYHRKDPYKPVVLAEGHYEGYTRKQYAGAILKKFLTDQQWFTWIPDSSILPEELPFSELTKTAVSAIGGKSILVYFPDRSPALVNLASLGEATNFLISWFNPETGTEIEAQSIVMRTLLTIYPPPDWVDAVAILKAEK